MFLELSYLLICMLSMVTCNNWFSVHIRYLLSEELISSSSVQILGFNHAADWNHLHGLEIPVLHLVNTHQLKNAPYLFVNANGFTHDDLSSLRDMLKEQPLRKIFVIEAARSSEQNVQLRSFLRKAIVDASNVETYWITLTENQRGVLVQPFCPGQYHSDREGNILDFSSGEIPLKLPWPKCPYIFQGQTIKVSAFGLVPYIVHGSTGTAGADFDILNVISKKLGFSYSILHETTWFKAHKNGTFYGSAGRVANGDSIIGLGHHIIVLRRLIADKIEYSSPTYASEVVILSRKPSQVAPYWNVSKPFSELVWLLLLVSFIFVLVFAASADLKRKRQYFHSAFAFLAPILAQSYRYSFNSWSIQGLFVIWLIATVIIKESYECNLRAYLMKVDFEAAIDSNADLLEQGRMLTFPNGSPFYYLYLTSPILQQRQVVERVDPKKAMFDYDSKTGLIPESVTKLMIEEGWTTLIGDILGISLIADLEPRYGYQHFRLGKKPLFVFHIGLIFQKSKPWNEPISDIVMRLYEAGIIPQFEKKYLPVKFWDFKTTETLEFVPGPFRLEHFLVAFMLLFIGFALAIITYSLEYKGR